MIVDKWQYQDLDVIEVETKLRQEHDNVTLLQKIKHWIQSIFNEILFFFFHFIPSRLGFHSFKYHRCEDSTTWKTESQGLYVLVHGLRGHPSIWNSHVKELQENPDLDVFVPYVHKQGCCPLEEAANPILTQVLTYIKQHPGKRICLLGASFGSLIVAWLEKELRKEAQGTAVKVSTIAGIHFGSVWVNHLENFGVARLILPHESRHELAFGNDTARALLEEILQPCPEDTEREYDFFATTEDFVVPHLNSALPYLKGKHRHFVVHGYGHNSIVQAVCKQQLDLCQTWISTAAA